eukprot:tig00021116_g18421.t1
MGPRTFVTVDPRARSSGAAAGRPLARLRHSPAGAQGSTSVPSAPRLEPLSPGLRLRPEGGPAAGSPAALSGWSLGLHLRPEGGPTAGAPATLPGWSPGLHLRPEGGPTAGSPAALSGWSPGLRLRPEVRHGLARPRAAARPAAAA